MKATLLIDEDITTVRYTWQICPHGNQNWSIISDPVYRDKTNARRAARKVAKELNIQLHEGK